MKATPMTPPTSFDPAAAGGDLASTPFASRLAALARAVVAWDARHRERLGFEALDDHLLRDVGLTRDALRRPR